MPRQSISFTEPNVEWLRARVESKEYSSNSDVINDLIRRAREQEVMSIREKLIEAERSVERFGYSGKEARQILEDTIAGKRSGNPL